MGFIIDLVKEVGIKALFTKRIMFTEYDIELV